MADDTLPAPADGDSARAAALMLASARFTDAEVAEATGLAPQHLDVLRRSPLFQASVARFRDRLYDEVRERLMADLMGDARANLQFINDARDGLVEGTPQMLRARLQAALALLDKQLPTKGGGDAPSVQIVIQPAVAERFTRAFAEAEVVDADE